MTVKDVLEQMGYKVSSSNNFWRMKALHRKSDSLSVSVNKETGWFEDFVTGQNGPLSHLVSLTLGISRQDGETYLRNMFFNKTYEVKVEEPEIKNDEKLEAEFLKDLLPSYGFYKNRGISESTLQKFSSGVKTYGKLNNRYVFPVFDHNGNLIGVSGRDLYNNSTRPKWKTLGKKNNFIFPHHLTGKSIEDKSEVILVESIGDGLALYESGIFNFLVLFGTKISKSIILYLIRQNVQKIIIATNNDSTSDVNAGLEGAQSIQGQLLKFFASDKIIIKLPPKNDLGDMNPKEIQEWYHSK